MHKHTIHARMNTHALLFIYSYFFILFHNCSFTIVYVFLLFYVLCSTNVFSTLKNAILERMINKAILL